MTYEAPKLATLVDDFRTIAIDLAQWGVTGGGGAPVLPTDTATVMRGLVLGQSAAATTVSSINTVGGRRADFWDSEIVWIIGRWATPVLQTLSITQSGGQYGYRFEYTNGVLVVKSVEAGVTYTGANFLNGSGGTVNWGQSLKYMRIAHNATTGKVEFYGGTNPDGSDQRILTSDLGTGAKGTLTPTQAQIDNVTVTMSVAVSATTTGYIRAVNAPFSGSPKHPDKLSTYHYRDFNTWTAYVPNRWISTSGLCHEWSTGNRMSTGTPLQVSDVDVTTRALIMSGDGGTNGRTTIRTAFSSGIRDVNITTNLAIISFADINNYAGIFWRAVGGSGNRYQMNIFSDRVRLDVFHQDAVMGVNYGALITSYVTLGEVALTTIPGQKYTWRVNHYENRIVITRDGVEVMSYNDSVGYLRDPGSIGFDAGSVTVGSSSIATFAVYDVEVSTAYDDQTFVSGIAMQDRGLGIHVKSGRRDGAQVTLASDSTLVNQMSSTLGVPLKTVFHYTDTSTPPAGTAPLDSAVIGAAIEQARQGRTNIISINAIRPKLSDFSPTMTNQYKADLLAWSNALNSIGGTVYAAILPYPDLNVPWSPNSYTKVYTVAVGSGSGAIDPVGGGLVTNALTGATVRYQSGGNMFYGVVTSNSTTRINFTPSASAPTAGTNFWIMDQAGDKIQSPADYITVYRAIVTYMRSVGCRANFVFSMNWAAESWTALSGGGGTTGQAWDRYFADFYPGNDYVDAFIIRAINNGVTSFVSGYGFQQWRPLDRMLQGETAGYTDWTYPYLSGQTPYYKMQAAASNKRIFVLAGSAETHSYFNDFSNGFSGVSIPVGSSNGLTATNDPFTTANTNLTWWRPGTIAEYNPRNANLAQYGVKHNNGATNNPAYAQWTIPTTNITGFSSRCYFRVDQLGVANASAWIASIEHGSGVVGALRVDQNTGALYMVNNSTGVGTGLAVSIVAGAWYRLDMLWSSALVTFRIVRITSNNNDRPDSTPLVTQFLATTPTQPTIVKFGNLVATGSGATTTIQNGVEIQDPKVSLDGQIATFSKGSWVSDALNCRGFAGVTGLILVSADSVGDVPAVAVSRLNGFFSLYTTSSVDTRLDGSKFSKKVIQDAITLASPERMHTAPQIHTAGYEVSASVGNIEYMRLEETGKVPLQIVPRIGGILLRDFNLGMAPVRVAQEDRPGADGIRDYTKFVGAKPVSLNFLTFDEASGSAAFYADVLATWANPRRRPRLVYKLKDGEERFINLRPEPTDSAWTVDGIRVGFKEMVLSFAGLDGKDYSSSVNASLLRQATMTQVTTDGTAATPPKIRIYGGSTGCLNPTLILQSEEQIQGLASARVSLGSTASSVFIPANQFIEIDMDLRTVQLNGLTGEGYSYLQYLSDRQWFYLQTYYNTLYLETDDGNGFAAVVYRDAYL